MRALLSIGCNDYDHAQTLTGAETDARRMFETLIRPNVGDYDPNRSKLLLSPTAAEVHQTLRDILFINNAIDTFTFFFAGHGSVRAGSFYMWVRDSNPDAVSLTAIPLSDIFRSLNEAAPAQSNIIIDACESGGLIADLSVLLKSDMLGDAETPGITLVATSAQNQNAAETENGGIGTNAILNCIEGRAFVQDTSSALDLVEIGRSISTRLRSSDQTPVVWGLNLYGPPRFCRNPHYGEDPTKPLRMIVQEWSSAGDDLLRKHYEQLWRTYTSVSDSFDPRAFADVISSVITPLSSSSPALIGFIERFGAATLERSELSGDAFRRSQVAAALAVSLLPKLDQEEVAHSIQRIVTVTSESLTVAGTKLAEELNGNRYALLAKRGGGLAELFYLPVRVAKILAWTAVIPSLLQESDECAEADQLFTNLLRLLLTQYPGSITTISDAQAPYWAITLSRATELGLTEEAEELTGLLFHSFIACKGQLARYDIPPEKTLDYLLARRGSDFTKAADLIARPNETLTVLLMAASQLGIGDIFDESLWEIDGLGFSAYLNPDFSVYGEDMMKGGQNLCWTIGTDVFRVADMVRTWPDPSPIPNSRLEAAIVMLAALLYPDRVPWFCLESGWRAIISAD